MKISDPRAVNFFAMQLAESRARQSPLDALWARVMRAQWERACVRYLEARP